MKKYFTNRLILKRKLTEQLGVALLEVMIAMFLFAISILGYSQVQMKTIHENYDGQQRAIAVRAASGLIDRMSANTSALDSYRTEIESFGDCPAAPVVSCADTGAAAVVCTDDELASYDVWYSFCGQDSGVTDDLIDFEPSVTCTGGACAVGVDMQLRLQWVSKGADSNSKIAADRIEDSVAMTIRL